MQPQLRLPNPKPTVLSGEFRTQFASEHSALSACRSPTIQGHAIIEDWSCLNLKMSSICGYTYNNYLARWDPSTRGANSSFSARPSISATLENNITVRTTILGSDLVRIESGDEPRISLYKSHECLPNHMLGLTNEWQ